MVSSSMSEPETLSLAFPWGFGSQHLYFNTMCWEILQGNPWPCLWVQRMNSITEELEQSQQRAGPRLALRPQVCPQGTAPIPRGRAVPGQGSSPGCPFPPGTAPLLGTKAAGTGLGSCLCQAEFPLTQDRQLHSSSSKGVLLGLCKISWPKHIQ